MKANTAVTLIETRNLTDDQMMELFRHCANSAKGNRNQKIERSIIWVIKQRTNRLTKVIKFAAMLQLSVFNYGSTIKDILGEKLSLKIERLSLNRLFVLAWNLDYYVLWKYVITRVQDRPDSANDEQLLEIANLARYNFIVYESIFLPILEKRFSIEKISVMTQAQLLNMIWSISPLNNIEKSACFKNAILAIGDFDEIESLKLISLVPSPDEKLGKKIELLLLKRVSKMNLDELLGFVTVYKDNKKAQLLILKKLKLDREGSENLVSLYIRYADHDLAREFVLEELESRTFTTDELLAYGHRVVRNEFWIFAISRIELPVDKWLELGNTIDSEHCWPVIIERIRNP